jgi:branched-chain amino acid transport system ATP-binding protein
MTDTAVGTTLLAVEELWAGYGPVQVLHGVTFEVRTGEVVVILGANGAGKTTTLRALCQMISTKGKIEFDGTGLIGRSTTDVVRRGIAHVPQGRGTFPDLSVRDNLEVGAFTRRDNEVNADIDRWFDAFPRLADRRTQQAGSLSGGEQQMLAIARALMGRPRLLLLDEPSLGLAPLIVQDLFRRLGALNAEQGITMLVVEQNANLAFDIAHRAYVLEAGRMALSGTADELRNDEAVRRAYLGY